MNIIKHNSTAWDHYVDKKDRWTIPVNKAILDKAKKGNWQVVLTPKKKVPHHWFPNLKDLKILGLASGGGQQGPILASLGADLTIFDNSSKQLLQDKKVSDEFNLNIKTIKGDMKDLSVFKDASFDLIFNPCSILFVDDILQVWKECHRVLKPNGILMTGLTNPLLFQLGEEDSLTLKYKQPYSDHLSLPPEKLQELTNKHEALCFGHSIQDQIGGQLAAGFMLTHFFEDDWGDDRKVDKYYKPFMATRAVKI